MLSPFLSVVSRRENAAVILLPTLRSDKNNRGTREGHSVILVSELIKRMKEDCILICIFTSLSSSALSSFSPGDRVPKPLEASWESVLTSSTSSHDHVQTRNQKAKCFYSVEGTLLCAQTSLSHKTFPSCPGLFLTSVPFLHPLEASSSVNTGLRDSCWWLSHSTSQGCFKRCVILS